MAIVRTVLSIVFFAAELVAWVIFLAGTGATYTSCVDMYKQPAGRKLMGLAEDTCSTNLSLTWWIVWFQALCIVLAILVASSNVMARFNNTLVALFVSVTTIMMYTASQANTGIFDNKDSRNNIVEKYVAGLRCSLAGMVITMVLNFIYLITATEESCGLALHLGCGTPRQPASFSTGPTAPSVTQMPDATKTVSTTPVAFAAPTTPAYDHNHGMYRV